MQLLAVVGRRSEARALEQRLKERALSEYVPFHHLAGAAFAAGHRDEAVSVAQQACAAREPMFVVYSR